MSSLKKLIKHIILGTQAVRAPLKLKSKMLTILCFHGVTQYPRLGETANFEGRHIHRSVFVDVLKYMLRYFNPVTIEQLDEHYYKGKALPRNPVLFTFDDGFANNYYHAFPVLTQLNCPAVIFLATEYMDNKSGFWVERLEYAIHNTEAKRLKITILENGFELPLATRAEKEIAFRTILGYLKSGLSFSEIEGSVQKICDHLGFASLKNIEDNEDYRFLTWDEVKEMARFRISFGAHTVNHVNLTYEDSERAEWEIRTSKIEIERHLCTECIAFCYPFGRSGYNSAMEELIKRAGFRFSFQLGGGLNDRNTNPLLLNRIPLGWGSKKEEVLWHILRK